MFSFFCLSIYAASHVAGTVIPRQNGAPDPGDATVSNPGLQKIPTTAKPDNTFSNGKAEIIGGFPYDTGSIPDVYQPRDIDIPFGRQFHGDLMMFPQGQLNDPSKNTGEYTPNVYDFANQSACGIPDNSYIQMKVAIHPYFLKYAGLDRYCMQDVCVSFWPENGPQGDYTNDMIAKVTDICSTDPNDPSHCATPSDIKVDRAKVQVMYEIPVPGIDNADLQKDKYVKGTYWHLTKCWANALPQPAYRDNWWAQPPLPNNFQWDVDATGQQYKNNQQSYPAKDWTTYPDGTSANAESEANIVPIDDWIPGQEPAWTPIAGGKGYGTPERSHGPPSGGSGSGMGSANSTASAGNSPNSTSSSGTSAPPASSSGGPADSSSSSGTSASSSVSPADSTSSSGTSASTSGSPADSASSSGTSATPASSSGTPADTEPCEEEDASTSSTPPSPSPPDTEPCDEEEPPSTSTSSSAPPSSTSTETSPSSAAPSASGAATSKRDGGRDWKLASGKRTVNGITYLNPAGWNNRALGRRGGGY